MRKDCRLTIVLLVVAPFLGCSGYRLISSEIPSIGKRGHDSSTVDLDSVKIESTRSPQILSSIDALKKARKVVLHNIANAETIAFKESNALLREGTQSTSTAYGRQTTDGAIVPLGETIGRGVVLDGTVANHTQGELKRTNQPLDVAIEGDGFFPLTDPAGGTIYTRNGQFTRNADGQIVFTSSSKSLHLEPAIIIPATATTISITSDGTVSYIEPPATLAVVAGQIQLAKFANPTGLQPIGKGLYSESAASGSATLLTPGQTGAGTLVQATLEASNVNLEAQLRLLKRIDQQLKVLRAAR